MTGVTSSGRWFRSERCACGGTIVVVSPVRDDSIEAAVAEHSATGRHRLWLEQVEREDLIGSAWITRRRAPLRPVPRYDAYENRRWA